MAVVLMQRQPRHNKSKPKLLPRRVRSSLRLHSHSPHIRRAASRRSPSHSSSETCSRHTRYGKLLYLRVHRLLFYFVCLLVLFVCLFGFRVKLNKSVYIFFSFSSLSFSLPSLTSFFSSSITLSHSIIIITSSHHIILSVVCAETTSRSVRCSTPSPRSSQTTRTTTMV